MDAQADWTPDIIIGVEQHDAWHAGAWYEVVHCCSHGISSNMLLILTMLTSTDWTESGQWGRNASRRLRRHRMDRKEKIHIIIIYEGWLLSGPCRGRDYSDRRLVDGKVASFIIEMEVMFLSC